MATGSSVPHKAPWSPDAGATASAWRAVEPYVSMARPDHWTKNVLMAPGVFVALFYEPRQVDVGVLGALALTLLATCAITSSNYVINEWLDAPTDRHHPVKCHRPAAAGRVRGRWVWLEWLVLGVAGAALAAAVNLPTAVTAAALWAMGVLYNVPPVRLKEWPYLDVLSESLNNALRLGLGWFAIVADRVPPLSLVFAYWMAGAYLMAVKRFAEYREIGDGVRAASYRHSFGYYDEGRLLVSSVFYATLAAMFGGMFILRYRLELVLAAPLFAGLFAHYLRIGFKPNSAAQHPERLHREGRLFLYVGACLLAFVLLMLVRIDALYAWFGVDPAGIEPLWRIP